MNDVQSLLLNTIGAALFGGKIPVIGANQMEPLLREGKEQAVFSLLFHTVEDQARLALTPERYSSYSEMFMMHAIAGARNFDEHTELHELMTAHGISYSVMKGFASALYYPEPSLRDAGDVDFLVADADIAKAGEVLEQAGFSADHGEDDDGIHIAYHRPPMSIWELHHSVNGVPSGEVGERIKEELDHTIESAVETIREDTVCRVPDLFYHGLILLLHTASHLTSEGVGLRHLCDWVVFAALLDDGEFRSLFEKKLKSFGLWRFAQALMLLGIRYLRAPKRVWALEAIECRQIDDDLLSGLMADILSGGNFGTKDMNRYREIKYISDRGEHTVGSGSIFSQGLKTLNSKVYADYKMIRRHRFLLPAGYIAEGGKYLGLLITGKRKSAGTGKMLQEAAERKRIYSSLKLFR